MKRFFSVVGAFIIATGLSCTAFTSLGFADSIDDSLGGDEGTDYDTVRQSAIDTIEAYQTSLAGGIDDDELKNKNLNTEQKAEVIKAYNLLNSEDQALYAELIARIERGGTPRLEYVGETEYDSAEDINYLQVIKATDNEDNNANGVMDLNATNTSCELTQDYTIDDATYQPYTLRCTVTDSDGNVSSLTQEVRIKTAIVDDENPGQTPDNPADNPDDQNPDDTPNDPGTNSPDDDKNSPNNPDSPNDDDNSGDDQEPDDAPGNNNPGNSDNNGGSTGDNNGANGGNNGSSDNNQTGDNNNSNTPTIPGSTGSDNNSSNNSGSSSKFPDTLPNTGPSALFSQIPTSVYYSVLIGLVVATTVFCLTKKTAETELVKDIR